MFDFDFVSRALLNGDLWAVQRKYALPELGAPFPPEVRLVHDTLRMWDAIEDGYGRLDHAEKERVRNESYMSDGPRFPGFFRWSKMERADPQRWRVHALRIATVLVQDCGEFARYSGAYRLNSSCRPIGYGRMLDAWRPIDEGIEREARPTQRRPHLLADDIIHIVRERIEPSDRRLEADGRWTPTKLIDDDVRVVS